MKIQLFLLGLNLLPILPLDGGHALGAVLETKGFETRAKSMHANLFNVHPNCYFDCIVYLYLPNTVPYLLLSGISAHSKLSLLFVFVNMKRLLLI